MTEPNLAEFELDTFALETSTPNGVMVSSLEAGTQIAVETRNSRYRFVVLDGPRSLVLVEGGAKFPKATVVTLGGATGDGSALKMGRILVGFRIEMWRNGSRIASSPVRSVAIESRQTAGPILD